MGEGLILSLANFRSVIWMQHNPQAICNDDLDDDWLFGPGLICRLPVRGNKKQPNSRLVWTEWRLHSNEYD